MENILVLIIIGLVLGYLFHVSSLRKKNGAAFFQEDVFRYSEETSMQV